MKFKTNLLITSRSYKVGNIFLDFGRIFWNLEKTKLANNPKYWYSTWNFWKWYSSTQTKLGLSFIKIEEGLFEIAFHGPGPTHKWKRSSWVKLYLSDVWLRHYLRAKFLVNFQSWKSHIYHHLQVCLNLMTFTKFQSYYDPGRPYTSGQLFWFAYFRLWELILERSLFKNWKKTEMIYRPHCRCGYRRKNGVYCIVFSILYLQNLLNKIYWKVLVFRFQKWF